MKRMRWLLSLLAMGFSLLPAQPKIIAVQRVVLPDAGRAWIGPQWSHNGEAIFVSSDDYSSIWRYDLGTNHLQRLVSGHNAGYGFTVSDDGNAIGYRVTRTNPLTHRRIHTAYIYHAIEGKSVVVATGADVGIPAFAGSQAVVLKSGRVAGATLASAANSTIVLGIEKTKIALLRNGTKVLLDPFGNGSYIWPSLSPDGTRLVAYEVGRGTFICDLDGNNRVLLGRRDAPSWTRDGKWIVYMDDKDDGSRLLSSDIACISVNGRQIVQLTNTPDVLEMHPRCSPVADRILCDTPDGTIYLLEYSEAGQ